MHKVKNVLKILTLCLIMQGDVETQPQENPTLQEICTQKTVSKLHAIMENNTQLSTNECKVLQATMTDPLHRSRFIKLCDEAFILKVIDHDRADLIELLMAVNNNNEHNENIPLYNVDVALTTKNKQTPLFIATKENKPLVVSTLLQLGANITQRNYINTVKSKPILGQLRNFDAEHFNTPIHMSLLTGNVHILRSFITTSTATAPLLSKNIYGSPLLHLAAHLNKPNVVNCLLDEIDNIDLLNEQNDLQENVLHYILKNYDISEYTETIALILEKEKELLFGQNYKTVLLKDWNNHGNTPLHLAVAREGADEIVTMLLDHNANINAQNEDNETPLHMAIKNSAKDTIIQKLINGGANIHITNKLKKTPLDLAKKYNLTNTIIMLEQAALEEAKKVSTSINLDEQSDKLIDTNTTDSKKRKINDVNNTNQSSSSKKL